MTVQGFAGNEKKFVIFRLKLCSIAWGSFLLIGMAPLTVTYFTHNADGLWLTVFCALLLVVSVVKETAMMRRVRAGTFEETGKDELVWKQFVRFRDKKPGRYLNRDF